MKTFGISILSLCLSTLLFFTACETEPVDIKPADTDFLISKILKEGKVYQEFIYNDNKKLIRVNFYNDDSVYHFEAYKYNDEGRAIKKEYSDDYYETYEYDESGRFIRLNSHYNDSVIYRVAEFTYNPEGQMEKGLIKFNDVETWDITYVYDSRGNVITRTEGPDVGSQLSRSLSEFEYDDKKNPRYNWGLPTDIVQYNNPLRYYNENMLSCALPPNYIYQYEYNEDGYPVKEIRNRGETEVYDTFYYEYLK